MDPAICDGISSLTIPSLENSDSFLLHSVGKTWTELMFNSSCIGFNICSNAGNSKLVNGKTPLLWEILKFIPKKWTALVANTKQLVYNQP